VTIGPITFDAGELVALDRNERAAWVRLKAAVAHGARPVVPAPVVTQVWRSGRQANLGRALGLLRVEPTDDALAREAGALCRLAGTSDAVDAIVVASAARRRGVIVTSDPADIGLLAAHVTGVRVVLA
jgi:hypothetical protein